MKVKVIISCWPSFLDGSSPILRSSIKTAFGDRAIAVLDESSASNIKGYGASVGKNEYHLFPSSHCYLSTSKNSGINTFTRNKSKHQTIADCDVVLLMDHDHGFTLDVIEGLMGRNLPVIGAAYTYRSDITRYVAGDLQSNGCILNCISAPANGLHRVDWVGGGFVLIKAEVFSLIEYPWFRRGTIDCGDTAEEMGEDIGFCLQLKDKNIPVYCDCDNGVKHKKEADNL